MFVTSLTSSVAFLSCTLSNIMPIRAFGVFATIVVMICFILTIHVQPLIYFLYEKYYLRREMNLDHTLESSDLNDFATVNDSFFSKFMSKYVFKCRHFLIALILFIYAMNVVLTFRIETTNIPDAVLKESNPVQKAYNWANYELWQ
jgi:predicted RND superfamily exporter protein